MKATGSGRSPFHRFPSSARPLVALIAAMFAPMGTSFALPTGEQVVAGNASISRPTAQNLNVQQSSPRAIINWQSFSIAAPESVSFRQPSLSSVVLNRVIGTPASEIAGRMSANGQVFLVNPNGVLFSSTAVVDVGGLVASTLDISNPDFLAGRYRLSGSGGAVTNAGLLRASDGGTVALLGGQVQNDGTITAKLGTVALAAGNRVTLDFAGDGLTKVTVSEGALAAEIQNRGAVIADGGQAVLTARAAEALTQAVVNQSGLVQARTLTERAGKIVLDGGDTGQTLAGGTLDASGRQPGQKGGEIEVLGDHVGVTGTALLDASGDAGGGSVLVGGDYQGKNPAVRNAAATWFGSDAKIRADAVTKGDGGKVIVWSDDTARAHGAITARGGAQGGDGGLVETSGKYLNVAGLRVNASAPYGKAGEWLLDPTDVTICNTCPTTGVTPGPNVITNATGANVLNTDIEAALNNGTSVSVSTSPANGVTFDAGEPGNIDILANTSITKSAGGDATLSFNAHNFIGVRDGVRISSSSGRLNLDFNSDSDLSGGGPIFMGAVPAGVQGVELRTNGGNVRMFGGGDPVNGRAQGNDAFRVGVQLASTTIDTRPLAGGAGGNVLIRGQGGSADNDGALFAGDGVLLGLNAVITTGSGNLTLDGIAGPGVPNIPVTAGAGVWLDQARLSTDTGTITLTGRGSTPGEQPGVGGDGVRLVPVSDAATNTITTNSGAIVINGTGGAGGQSIAPIVIAGAGGSGFSTSNSSLQTGSGNITIKGEGGGGGQGSITPMGTARVAALVVLAYCWVQRPARQSRLRPVPFKSKNHSVAMAEPVAAERAVAERAVAETVEMAVRDLTAVGQRS